MKRLLTLILVLCALPVVAPSASAQNFYSFPQKYPNGSFFVCGVPANGNPCSNQVSIFPTSALVGAIAQPATIGPDGNYGFWVAGAQGQITIQVQPPFATSYVVSLGGSAGGGSSVGTAGQVQSTDGAGAFTNSAAQGTIAVSTPVFSHTVTWNAGAVAFTNWLSNITCTAAATASIAAGWGTSGTQWQMKYAGANCATPQFIVPAGTVAAPLLVTSSGTTTGFNTDSSGNVCLVNGGNAAVCTNGTASTITYSGGVFAWTSTGLPSGATGTKDTGLSRTAANVIAAGNGTAADETALIRSGNACRVTADITLPVNTATTVCSWSLPATAKSWAWQCQIPWVISAGTGTNTLAIIANPSQTPTGTTNGTAEIKTTNTNTATEATTAISASGATTLLTSGTITPAATVFQSSTSGTLLASGTAGTFAIQMTAAGTTATAAAKAGATCILY